jgi:hypothetical protein
VKLVCSIDTFTRHHQTNDESGSDSYYAIWLDSEGLERPILLRAPMHWYPQTKSSEGNYSVDDDAAMLRVLREVQKRINGEQP